MLGDSDFYDKPLIFINEDSAKREFAWLTNHSIGREYIMIRDEEIPKASITEEVTNIIG